MVFGVLVFIRKHSHSEHSLSPPPTIVYMDFYYSRSISIDMGVFLMLGSHMDPDGPWIEVFQFKKQEKTYT